MKTHLLFLLIFLFSIQLSPELLSQDSGKYQVVINHEEQYSVWPVKVNPPDGWRAITKPGSLKKCSNYIRKNWTDMRPLSIQKEYALSDKYAVVINHEEQYSIWPAKANPPDGWKTTDIKGAYAECFDYIEEVWTDMRPLSVRKKKISQ
jgi:MbtH protein